MTSLVIGGTGFLGRRLVARLLEAGERVVATSRGAKGRFEAPALQWRDVDLASFDAWAALLDGISAVYHLAWSTSPAAADADPAGDLAGNVAGSIRILDALKSHGARLVFASSGGAVYGRLARVPVAEDAPARPIGAHGLAKLALENYIGLYTERAGLDAMVLRIGNAFGPSQPTHPGFGVVAHYARQAAAGLPVVVFGDGSAVRDYVYVDDVIEALCLAGRAKLAHRVFNIGSGRGKSLLEVVQAIERTLGRSVTVQFEPVRPFDVPVSILDVTRAREHLGWTAATPFDTGIARTLPALAGGKERR